MKLRWLIKQYPEPLESDVKALFNSSQGITMGQAYSKLKKPNEKVLQMFIYDNSTGLQDWVDVPVVVELVENE